MIVPRIVFVLTWSLAWQEVRRELYSAELNQALWLRNILLPTSYCYLIVTGKTIKQWNLCAEFLWETTSFSFRSRPTVLHCQLLVIIEHNRDFQQ